MGEESRRVLGLQSCPLPTRQCGWREHLDVWQSSAACCASPDNREDLRNLSLRGPDCAGAREVAPITIDAGGQFDQNQFAILQSPPGRAIESPRVGAVGAGLHHGPASGMKYFIATNLPVNSRLYRRRNFRLRNSRLQIFEENLQANIRYPVCQPDRSDLLRSFS